MRRGRNPSFREQFQGLAKIPNLGNEQLTLLADYFAIIVGASE
jgi:hypothetical protein